MSKIEGLGRNKAITNSDTSNFNNKELESKVLLIIEKLVYSINKFKINIDNLFKKFDSPKTNFLRIDQFEEMLLLIDKSLKKDEILLAF